MKKIWISLSLVLIAASCDDNSSQATNETKIVNAVTTGSWRITYYYDTDKEETTNYTGYNFTFGPSTTVTATKGTATYTGTWSITDSNSSDDSINDLHFNLLFTTPALLEELSDDWDILEYSDRKIKFIDVSGGSGGTDYLMFEKN